MNGPSPDRLVAIAASASGIPALRGGGVVIAQDQATSEWFSMSGWAIATGAVDYILPLERTGPKLVALLDGPAQLAPTAS
jgi:two-component system chemotaxis response regulator CheB